MSTPSPAVAPSPNLVTPANQNQALPTTPSMALADIGDSFAAALSLDPNVFKDASKDDTSNFFLNFDADLAAMFANPLTHTPQAQYTPAVVPNSPAIDMMAGIHANPAVRQMPTPLFGPESAQLGLMGLDTGAFGFAQAQDPFGTDSLATPGFQDLNEILEQLGGGPTMTISPRDLQAPPSSTFTPSPFTPAVAKHTPLLATPASATAPLSATAAHQAATTDSGRKRPSPLSDPKRLKRGRSDEDGLEQSGKRRKHTGTRPGITSEQLLPPGAPPQQKTYVTESSTSRKDIPASYKLKPGELPDDTAMNKIVAKRTANRDSARRSRMRKQAAMEHAMRKVTVMEKRIEQLEEFCRVNGLEPPPAMESMDSPIDDNEDGD